MSKDFGDTVVMDEDYVASIRPEWEARRMRSDSSHTSSEPKKTQENNARDRCSVPAAGTTWLS